MSQSLRQNNLFMGQDWTVIYQAFNFVNFNAYDYDSIRQALIDYIRISYPEDFNDWIDSSEFVAIIEMLAYLASSLAFRIDLNIRENFIDTATRRESILRLARMLSYSPRRCVPAQGLLKLSSIITDQQVYDSNGVNLSNLKIIWNDTNNPDWYEQFIVVLNACLLPTNPFGQPVKSGDVGTLPVQRYDFNNTLMSNMTVPFNAVVSGTAMNFEICNTDFLPSNGNTISSGSAGYFFEKSPSILNPMSVLYLNDGNGNASPGTGFFVLFKQGRMNRVDYTLLDTVPNRILDVNVDNINQSDIWVHNVDDSGNILAEWTKVPALASANIVYNSVNRVTRNICQVITRDNNGNDAVSIRFGDGNFGNIPSGKIRVTYRTSNNLTYSILPTDISSVNFSLNYVNNSTAINNVQMEFALSGTVANALSRESNAAIQDRAPAVYYTQNRMVNGEDYNIFPLQSSQALKLKAVNRTYSGQSRHFDLNDPTSTYQNTRVFSNDGRLFQEQANHYEEIPLSLNLNASQIIATYLSPMLSGSDLSMPVNVELRDFYLNHYRSYQINLSQPWWQIPANISLISWSTAGDGTASTTLGNFRYNNQLMTLPDNGASQLRMGTLIKFRNSGWSQILDLGLTSLNTYTVSISNRISNNDQVEELIPGFTTSFGTQELALIEQAINSRTTFGLTFRQKPEVINGNLVYWQVISRTNIAEDADFSLNNQGNSDNRNLDASWLLQMKYVSGSGWQLTCRGSRYVFESERDVRFYKINSSPVTNPQNGQLEQDNISILKVNGDPRSGLAMGKDYYWSLRGSEIYPDGYVEPSRARLSLWDSNQDGIPDDPDQFEKIVSTAMPIPAEDTALVNPDSLHYLFWKTVLKNGYLVKTPFVPKRLYVNLQKMLAQHTLRIPIANTNPVRYIVNPIWTDGDVVYLVQEKIFLHYSSKSVSVTDVSSDYQAAPGRGNLYYSWQHVVPPDQRVDPAVMNIIDIYVLSSAYDTAMRNWIANGKGSDPMPTPATPESLRITFQEFDSYKMMTDQIVWHPASYKILFGSMAPTELQVVFKAVKLPGANITDSELKSRIINAINNYFSIVNWGFGQSFFFTELAAYIHQQNPSLLSSVVIVPLNADSKFGDLFEISCAPDEIFISAARVTDIQIVNSLNPSELRLT